MRRIRPPVMPLLARSLAAALACCLASTTEAAPSFSIDRVLSYPFPTSLVAAPDGRSIAYAIDQRGIRSIWIAQAPGYAARRLVLASADDGQDYGELQLSRGGSYVVYVRGSKGASEDFADPAASPLRQRQAVWSVNAASDARRLLGEGDAPAISPDGARVAFVRAGAVWIAPIDGSGAARPLFYDLGQDSDLQWSPSGNALAFVSSRDDHALIGVYRDRASPLQFLAPSDANDTEPRWSPDGTRIAFARTPGSGGAIPSPLQPVVVPWSIWVARLRRSTDVSAAAVWQSPRTPRASFPTQGGDVELNWASSDRIAFVSEMDGWSHAYSVAANGGTAHPLTPGPFDVGGIALSRDRRWLVYDANAGAMPGDVDRSHLFIVPLGGGRSIALADGADSQWWPTPLAGGELAYVEATSQRPPLVALRSTMGSGARSLDSNLMPSDFPTADLVTPLDVTFHASDGTLVHGQLLERPSGKKRPAIVFVHGGPMRQMLLTWHPMDYYSNAYAVNQALAALGFAVLSVNYRTGTGYGHDFHYAPNAGWTGASEYQDVLAGARWLQREPTVDSSRIGIWGGSWGGYLTALALGRDSDVFKAGVDFSGVHSLTHDTVDYFGTSAATYPVPDWRRWLALAWRSSPDAYVARWRSPVLLIAGDDDPDVSFHQTVDLIERLRAHNVPFEQIVLPDEVHGFLRYASWLRADRATVQFFVHHLTQ